MSFNSGHRHLHSSARSLRHCAWYQTNAVAEASYDRAPSLALYYTNYRIDDNDKFDLPVSAVTSCCFWSPTSHFGVGSGFLLGISRAEMLSTLCFTCISSCCEQVLSKLWRMNASLFHRQSPELVVDSHDVTEQTQTISDKTWIISIVTVTNYRPVDFTRVGSECEYSFAKLLYMLQWQCPARRPALRAI